MSQLSVGTALAEARAASGLTLDELAEITKSRPALLRAMEAGDFEVFGGTVYAKGHVRAYAQAVGIDAAPLVTLLEKQQGPVTPSATLVAESVVGSPDLLLRSARRPWLAMVSLAAAVVLALAVVSLLTGGSPRAPRPAASGLPVIPTSAPVSSVAVTVPSGTSAAMAVSVTIQVLDQPSWIGLYRTGTKELTYQATLAPGTTKVFKDPTAVSLRIGKPEAVYVFVNGRRVASPGSAGQATDVTYGPDGVRK